MNDLEVPAEGRDANAILESVAPSRASRRRSRHGSRDAQSKQSLAASRRSELLPVVVLLALTIVLSVLALGTVHVSVLLFVAPLAVASGGFAFRRERWDPSAIPPPAWVAFGLSAYSAAQALPLPLPALRWLSPASASLWTSALASLGSPQSWASLSLDPAASVVEALKWFCYGAVFCAGAEIANAKSRRAVPGIVFGAALLAAIVTLAHRLAGAESLYGLYTPLTLPRFAMAPLVNPNNFAGYLNLGAFAGIGLLMGRESSLPRWAIGLGVSVIVGLSAVCGSRGGLASLALGMVALVVARRVLELKLSRVSFWVPVATLVGGVALFLLGVQADLWQSMLKEGLQKIALISWTTRVVADFPIFGVGRGAFETVFPSYRADVGHHIYQFAENFVMQWCVEWGVPVALLALLGFAYTLRKIRLRSGSEALVLSCGLGVFVLLAQNLFDLALEVPSVSLALFALLGSLWAGRSKRRMPPAAPRRLWLPAGFSTAFVLLWCFSASAGLHTAQGDRRAISNLVQAKVGNGTPSDELRQELRAAIRRHPADPYFPLIAATIARGREKNELAWIARAIERDPFAGRPYLVLADALARRHAQSQALNAVRLAVEREYELIGPGAKIALALTHRTDELMQAVPAGKDGVGMLVHLAQQGEAMRPHRELLLRTAMDRDRAAVEPRIVRGEDLLSSLEASREGCAGAGFSGCSNEVRDLAAAIERIDPSIDRPTVMRGRLLMLEANPQAAYRLLAEKCHNYAVRVDCMRVRFLAAEKLDDPALEESSAAYLAEACSTAPACSNAAAWLGTRFEAAGRPAPALRYYERAAHEAETEEGWKHFAESAQRLGFPAQAERGLRRTGLAGAPVPPSGDIARILQGSRVGSDFDAAGPGSSDSAH